jgi:hypothetical protein
MPPFRFIQARLPDPAHSKAQITERLLAHRRKLLAARQQQAASLKETGGKNDPDWLNRKDPLRLDPEESRKIERRATRVSDRCSQGSGLSHLKPDDLKKPEALRGGVRLVRIATEHQADELAAALHAEYPWMAPATEAVWHGMRRSVREGDIGLRLPPCCWTDRRALAKAPVPQNRSCHEQGGSPRGNAIIRDKTTRFTTTDPP